MENDKAATSLIKKLEKVLRRKMGPVFKHYGISLDSLLTPLKWKPLVLVIGNYSSGKSTFINELLGKQVQRTGQAPTDDSFTILTLPETNEEEKKIPGNTVVNDDRLPFSSLKKFGETLISHLQMKYVNAPILRKLSIIDTPGMLDSVTEKDRRYDYLGVVGELAKLADLIILMFDPHKAGTIKETYRAIRTTLPDATGEDRVLYVLNRVDECDNTSDLVRSYGTLCWNLSQMTGRKDMPRIFLTYAELESAHGTDPADTADEYSNSAPGNIWVSEREELKLAVEAAPRLRLNHILQEVDREIRELALRAEALAAFRKDFRNRLQGVLKIGTLAALSIFCLGDFLLNLLTGYPETTLIGTIMSGSLKISALLWPAVGGLFVLAVMLILIQRYHFPRYLKKTLTGLDNLIPLETAYKRDLWHRVKENVHSELSQKAHKLLFSPHTRYQKRMESFIEKDLHRFYERIQGSA